MTVVELFAKRHVKLQTEAPNKILLVVAIVDDRMHHADVFQPGIKIKTHDKR